jgi:hypothetical protein
MQSFLIPMSTKDPSQGDGEPGRGDDKERSSRFAGFKLILPAYPKGNTLETQQAKLVREQYHEMVSEYLFERGIARDDSEVNKFATTIRKCFNNHNSCILQTDHIANDWRGPATGR